MKNDIEELCNQAVHKANELYHATDYDVALTFCNQVIKINPDLSDAWFIKGMSLKALNRQPEAYEAFTKASELSPLEINKSYAEQQRDRCNCP